MNIAVLGDSLIVSNAVSTVAFIAGGLAARIFINRLVKIVISKVDDGDDSKNSMLQIRSRTIGALISSVAGVVLFSTVITMILSRWGVNIAPILAGAGVIGLAVGFGAQTLVKDVVTGFFILFENQFNVGDDVEIAGSKGKVIALNLRTTVLKGSGSEIYIIPNSKIDKVVKM